MVMPWRRWHAPPCSARYEHQVLQVFTIALDRQVRGVPLDGQILQEASDGGLHDGRQASGVRRSAVIHRPQFASDQPLHRADS